MYTGTWPYKFCHNENKHPIPNIRYSIFIFIMTKMYNVRCLWLYTLYINVSVERRMTRLILTRLGYFPSHILHVVYVMMKGRALTWILLEMDPVRAVCRTTTGSPGILPWVKTKQRRYDPTRRFRSVMSRIGCTASYWEICNRNRSKLRLW